MTKPFEIPLSAPDITDREIARVVEVLRSSRLSLGPKLEEFERMFAQYIGTRFAVAVNSGTSALHLAVKSFEIGQRDAVITTPFSFIASANCILFEQAIPVFLDIDPHTLNIDPDNVSAYLATQCQREKRTGIPVERKSGRRIRAILPVHVFGNPCAMDRLVEIAVEYALPIIEDACEALGAEFKGRKIGGFGEAGTFAFYPNKQMTTGEGGMLVTDDERVARICRSLRNQGRDHEGWLEHNRLGYNYRLSDINCALGIAQIERITEILEKRARVAAAYTEGLEKLVALPTSLPDARKSWFVYVLCLPAEYTQVERDRMLERLKERHIGCGNYFPPIHLQPLYRKRFGYKPGDFPITEFISERTIALPFHNNLTAGEISYVLETLVTLLQEESREYRGLAATA